MTKRTKNQRIMLIFGIILIVLGPRIILTEGVSVFGWLMIAGGIVLLVPEGVRCAGKTVGLCW